MSTAVVRTPTPPDWWENVPREEWSARIDRELHGILHRCPRTALFLTTEEANYRRDVRRKALTYGHEVSA